jgi:aldehyde:ferredoxin oxidoreductase
MKFGVREMDPEKVDEIYGIRGYGKVKKGKIACPSCIIADKDLVAINEGAYQGLISPIPSFLNVAILGYRLDLEDTYEAVKLLDVLDGYGLDFLMFGAFVDFLLFLFEQEVLNLEDTQGLRLRRNMETYLQLACLIGERKGWGKLLAQGWEAVLQTVEQKIGKDRLEEVLKKGALSGHTYGLGRLKGLEWVTEPRESHLGTMEFTQVVSPRGGQVGSGVGPTYVLNLSVEFFRKWAEGLGATPHSLEKIFDTPLGFNVGRLTRYTEDWYSAFNSLGICGRMMNSRVYPFETCASLYSAVTGIDLPVRELVRASERVWNLYRLLNLREGFSQKDDQFPEEWFQPLQVRGLEKRAMDYYRKRVLCREDLIQLRRDYYDERGWDPETGVPTREKLEELGLTEFRPHP